MTSQVMCLAIAIFFEARGEPIDGQEMVANVILNRVEHSSYPDSICGVVNQPYQFSYTHELPRMGLSMDPEEYTDYPDKVAWEAAKHLARKVVDKGVINPYIIMYHSVSVEPYWAEHYVVSGQVGNHIFYGQEND